MNNLKAYRFVYRNPKLGVITLSGGTHWGVETSVVFATSEEKAREAFEKHENRRKEKWRRLYVDQYMKPADEVEELIDTVFTKADMTVEEHEIKDGLVLL